MNRTSSARSSENSDRYCASGLIAEDTATSGPAAERSTSRSAPRAANGTTIAAARTATATMPAPSAVRRRSAPDGRRETWTPLDAAARRSDRIRSSRLRQASHRRQESSPAMPSAVSSGATIVIGASENGELTVVRPKNSPNEIMPSATGTAPYAARPSRQARRSPAHVPARNTMRAGTRRLRYVPTGRSTVIRSFQAKSAPVATSPRPRNSGATPPRRDGTASGTPSTKNARTSTPATGQPPQRRIHASAAIAAPTSAATPTSSGKDQSR